MIANSITLHFASFDAKVILSHSSILGDLWKRSAAAKSSAAKWKWPPPELASPQRLPLAVAPTPSDANNNRQLQTSGGFAADIRFLSPTPYQAAALPGSWYQPEVVAAAISALQRTAVAGPIDENVNPARFSQSLTSAWFSLRSRYDQALSDDSCPSCTTSAWQPQAEAVLQLRVSALSDLRLPHVVHLQPGAG